MLTIRHNTQMHYNQGADLLTYLSNPEVFRVKEGYVDILKGLCL